LLNGYSAAVARRVGAMSAIISQARAATGSGLTTFSIASRRLFSKRLRSARKAVRIRRLPRMLALGASPCESRYMPLLNGAMISTTCLLKATSRGATPSGCAVDVSALIERIMKAARAVDWLVSAPCSARSIDS
jgi:hypothetical protein